MNVPKGHSKSKPPTPEQNQAKKVVAAEKTIKPMLEMLRKNIDWKSDENYTALRDIFLGGGTFQNKVRALFAQAKGENRSVKLNLMKFLFRATKDIKYFTDSVVTKGLLQFHSELDEDKKKDDEIMLLVQLGNEEGLWVKDVLSLSSN